MILWRIQNDLHATILAACRCGGVGLSAPSPAPHIASAIVPADRGGGGGHQKRTVDTEMSDPETLFYTIMAINTSPVGLAGGAFIFGMLFTIAIGLVVALTGFR